MTNQDDRIKEVHRQYIEVICPYILQYELLDNNFPVEILNEIRAIFTHLSKYHLSDDLVKNEENLTKAEGHVKRAILDCYKYICIAFDDKYKRFEEQYKHTDLSLVDNGDFLPNLLNTRKKALDLLLDARKSELNNGPNDENCNNELYAKYEAAFIEYEKVDSLIDGSFIHLEHLRKKAVIKDILAIGSFVFGAVSVIVAILLRFL